MGSQGAPGRFKRIMGRAMTYFGSAAVQLVIFILTQIWDIPGHAQNGSWWSEKFPVILQWGCFCGMPIAVTIGFILVWKERRRSKVGLIPKTDSSSQESPRPKRAEERPAKPAKALPQPEPESEQRTEPKMRSKYYDMPCRDVLEYARKHSGLITIPDVEDDLTHAARTDKIHVRAIPVAESVMSSITATFADETKHIQPGYFNNHRFCLRLSTIRTPFDILTVGKEHGIVSGSGILTMVTHLDPIFVRSEIEKLWPSNDIT